ncbi:MAG: hypothetical protein RL518_661 [Pseudomonadota bacterium]|jgi:hypothetical protein
MSAVAIKSKIAGLTRTTPQAWPQEAGLCSDTTSWALSLDFALSKKPRWLLDMFGVDQSGAPIIKRLFIRMNPEKKRPGPAWVSMNPAFLDPKNIGIFLDGVEVIREPELRMLLKLIGLGDEASLPKKGARQVVHLPKRPRSLFDMIKREVLCGLNDTAVFSSAATKTTLSFLANHNLFQHIGGRPNHLLGDLDLGLTDSARLGLGMPESWMLKQLCSKKPIRILCGVGAVTSLCIFRYLTSVKGYNFEVSHNFSSSQDIIHSLRSKGKDDLVDGVLMAFCCSVRLCQGRSSFSPLVMMPITTHAELSRGKDVARYLFLTDVVTGSHFHLDDERQALEYQPKVEPLPFAGLEKELAKHSDARAVLFWPYYEYASGKNEWKINESFRRVPAYELVNLCVNQRISRDAKLALAINIAIRDAWLTLRTNPALVDRMIVALIDDPKFFSAFSRLGPDSMMRAVGG